MSTSWFTRCARGESDIGSSGRSASSDGPRLFGAGRLKPNKGDARTTLLGFACACSLLIGGTSACDEDEGDSCDPDAGYAVCGSSCTSLREDDDNCGVCGNRCREREECELGECVCIEGLTRCNGICEVTLSDRENCGACGNVCEQPEPDCSNGHCTCRGQFCFPYCVREDDHDNCLECGNACAFDEICVGTCLGRGCPPDECVGGDGRDCDPPCDGAANQLCCRTPAGDRCADIRTDRENCGGCGNECICGGRECNCTDGECPVF